MRYWMSISKKESHCNHCIGATSVLNFKTNSIKETGKSHLLFNLGMLFLFRRIFLDKLLNHKVWTNQTASPLKQLWGRRLHSPFSLRCFQTLGTGVAGPTVHWAPEQGFPLSRSPESCPGYHLPLGLDHLFLWKLQNSVVYKNPNCFFDLYDLTLNHRSITVMFETLIDSTCFKYFLRSPLHYYQ